MIKGVRANIWLDLTDIFWFCCAFIQFPFGWPPLMGIASWHIWVTLHELFTSLAITISFLFGLHSPPVSFSTFTSRETRLLLYFGWWTDQRHRAKEYIVFTWRRYNFVRSLLYIFRDLGCIQHIYIYINTWVHCLLLSPCCGYCMEGFKQKGSNAVVGLLFFEAFLKKSHTIRPHRRSFLGHAVTNWVLLID